MLLIGLIAFKWFCWIGTALAFLLILIPDIGIRLNEKVLNAKIRSCGFLGTVKPSVEAPKIVRIQAFLIFVILLVLALTLKY